MRGCACAVCLQQVTVRRCVSDTVQGIIHYSDIKKVGPGPVTGKSYRPISNLTVQSKTLERLVARQLVDYLSERKLLPELQSAYRAYHSTETAVLRVLSDIFEALTGPG